MDKIFESFLRICLEAAKCGPAKCGGKAKKQDCTHCSKQTCKGEKCATCCSKGKYS